MLFLIIPIIIVIAIAISMVMFKQPDFIQEVYFRIIKELQAGTNDLAILEYIQKQLNIDRTNAWLVLESAKKPDPDQCQSMIEYYMLLDKYK